MFRSILSSLLLTTYLFSMIGVTGSVHYCGGMMASINLIVLDGHNCPCGEEMMDPDCCKDVAFEYKVKDVHSSAKIKAPSIGYAILEPASALEIIEPLSAPIAKKIAYADVDRKPPDIDLYKLHESYLI